MKRRLSSRAKGFTLLEVLFAFMAMATGIMMLWKIQSNSVNRALEGRAIVVASELARKKLVDCRLELEKSGFASASNFERDGDFSDEGFEDITWECRGTRIDVPAPNLEALSQKTAGEADGAPGTGGGLSAVLGPIFGLLASSLGDSARELSVVVRWEFANRKQDMKVTTHLVNTQAITALLNSLGGPPKK